MIYRMCEMTLDKPCRSVKDIKMICHKMRIFKLKRYFFNIYLIIKWDFFSPMQKDMMVLI